MAVMIFREPKDQQKRPEFLKSHLKKLRWLRNLLIISVSCNIGLLTTLILKLLGKF